MIGGAVDITKSEKDKEKIEQYSKHLEDLVEKRTKQLKESERLAAIGQTAGMVGHDIRNPLQAIVSDLYIAKQELESTPESETKRNTLESLNSIETNIFYINKIVADLQDYSRVLRPEKVDINLSELFSSVVLPINIPHNVAYEVDVEPSFFLKSDVTLLRRVLTNLITNAVQAMPDGGKLRVSGCRHGDKVLLIVEDTGHGIPDDIKSKLFTPMVTTKSKGQGLGLAVVNRLVEAMNGTISFESEEGKGTKFIIELPVKD
jgi:signal transduction histidine kinase